MSDASFALRMPFLDKCLSADTNHVVDLLLRRIGILAQIEEGGVAVRGRCLVTCSVTQGVEQVGDVRRVVNGPDSCISVLGDPFDRLAGAANGDHGKPSRDRLGHQVQVATQLTIVARLNGGEVVPV